MKLILATPLYPPEIGGPATYARELVEGLSGKGIEVEVVKFSEVRKWPKLIRHYVYFRRVLRAAKNADVVLALDPVSTGLSAMQAAKRAGKPFLVKIVGDYAWEQGMQRFGVTEDLDAFVHAKHHWSFSVRRLRSIQTRVALAAAKIIVPSVYLRRTVGAWGIPEDHFEVIHNAVEVTRTGNVPATVATLPRPLIVTAGRLVSWKHVDGIIDAIARLRVRGVPVSLAVVGEGPERMKLQKYAEEALITDFAFTGMLAHIDLLAVIQSADVFVLNSSYEGFSHLLIEACELSVATVATNVGGNPEIIEDEKNGFLVPPHDTPALTDGIEEVLEDSVLRAKLSQSAALVAGQFTREAMLAATAKVIADVVSAPEPNA